MLTKQQIQEAEQAAMEVAAPLAVEVASQSPALAITKTLEADAAEAARRAATHIERGDRSTGRVHLHFALEKLNEAEIED